MRVALSEGGTGWIPYFLDRLDRTYDMHHLWTGQDFGDRTPSRRVPRALPHVLHRGSDRPQAARTTSGSTTSAGSRTTRTPTRRGRRAAEELAAVDAPACPTTRSTRSPTRTHAAGTPSIRSHRTREQCTVGALRAEAAGHDVAIRSFDHGRFERTVGRDPRARLAPNSMSDNATAAPARRGRRRLAGLGRCIGTGLAHRGAHVALLARRYDRLVDAAKERRQRRGGRRLRRHRNRKLPTTRSPRSSTRSAGSTPWCIPPAWACWRHCAR